MLDVVIRAVWLDRFRQLPGVEAVGLIDNLHLTTTSTQTIGVNADGVEPPPGRESHVADRAVVDRGFFDAVGIPILEGRNFGEGDLPDTPPVATHQRRTGTPVLARWRRRGPAAAGP